MAKAQSDFERFSTESLTRGMRQDVKGRFFVSPKLSFDLSHILFCLSSVDTVRQLYFGELRQEFFDMLARVADSSDAFLELSPGCFWSVGRLGKVSGYRYRIQNNEEGVILLVGSYYATLDRPGAHLKIELSPHFLASRGVKQIQAELNLYSHRVLKTSEPTGCAVHLALDVQHWAPSCDFGDRFTTRARAVGTFDGISSLEFEGLSEVVLTYGRGSRQSFMFGRASALQCVIYDKSREILVSDKVDYFHQQWGVYTLGEFDSTQPVWRIEMRVHHNVMREIAEGQGETWKTFEHVSKRLTDVWRYCLRAYRLNYSVNYIDPVWQLFRDDPEFLHPALGLWIRRRRKQDQAAIARNYGAIVGNLISVYVRQGFDAQGILRELKRLAFYPALLDYHQRVLKCSEADLRDRIRRGLLKRRALGKAAAGFSIGEEVLLPV